MLSVLLLISASLLVARAEESCTNGQVWSVCASCEKTCDSPAPICPAVCMAKCTCPPEQPIWHNNRCIKMDQCKHSCTNGQVWTDCASGCVPTCNAPPSQVCTLQCVERCHCPLEKPVWDNNRCITTNQCNGSCSGGLEWQECGSACPKTCDVPQPACTKQCFPGCHCPLERPFWQAGRCLTGDQCQLKKCVAPAEPGPCEAYMPSWAYNYDRQRCEKFIYGGCNGNDNRFSSEEQCMEECDELSGVGVHLTGSASLLMVALAGLYWLL